jgi:hypothetical protein
MQLRFGLGAVAACTLLYCAAGGSDEAGGEFTDGGVVVGEGGPKGDGATGSGSGGSSGGSSSGGSPGVFDGGGPANVGGGQDAGGDGAGGEDSGTALGAGCSTLTECPYENAPGVSAVACEDAGCSITCNGENYDVNGTLSDGCEVAGTIPASNGGPLPPLDDHSQNNAAYVGAFPCDDGSSGQNLTGTVPSDARTHSPAVDGLVTTTGAAPQFFRIYGEGGTFCEDDANLTITMNAPTSQMNCYVMTLITDKQTQTCTTSGGTCSISNGSGSYTDGSNLYVSVTKDASCLAGTTNDDAAFTITGHL